MGTKTNIKFEMFDATAKEDSSVNIEDKQDFVDLNDLLLEAGELTEIKYGTLEKNQFALDGTFELMPDELDNMGLWSSSMTDENGEFETPPVLEVTFTEVHSSAGLTLLFSKAGDYCNHANVKYYDSDDNILADEDFYLDDYLYIYNLNVENYTKLIVTFYSTNNPYRYLKLYRIDYGIEKNFTEDSLTSANLLEEIDMLSSEISINTLEFTVYSDDDEFNIINPTGLYSLLQERQKLKVTEVIDEDEEKDMGAFYLDEWTYEKDKSMKFKAIDLIGLIDKTTFYGGMYEDVTFMDIMLEILESAGLDESDCEIDEDIQNTSMSGYIPVCTHREAIQQLAFAVCAIVDCSRSDKIKIYKIDNTEKEELTISRESDIFQGTREISQMDIITGVALTLHTYEKSSDVTEITEDTDTSDIDLEEMEELCSYTLTDTGKYILSWDEPAYSIVPVNEVSTDSTNTYGVDYGMLISYNCNSATIQYDADIATELIAKAMCKQLYEERISSYYDEDEVYYSYDGQEDEYKHYVAVRSCDTTYMLEYYLVDLETKTVTVEETYVATNKEDVTYTDVGASLEVKVYGFKYNHSTSIYQLNGTVQANKGDNVLEVDTAYFITKDNMSTIAQNILDYYDESYEDKFEKVLADESISSLINVDTEFDQNLQGNIKSIDIDLQGGFLGEIIAISKVVDSSG